ncbi:MAG TPA: glycosylase, partial [Actinoplanes sp.]|nr:glycosylase [Actinoplanes sp.]
ASAVLGPGSTMRLEDRSGPLLIGQRTGARHLRDLLAAGLHEEDVDNELAATVLGELPERYDDADFEDVLGSVPSELLARPTTQQTLEIIRRIVATDYAVTFPANVPLHQRVLWPAAPAERNGMEDARFVHVLEPDGRSVYQATYTAYDGRHIAGRMLTTRDLRHFEVTALRGPAALNKGMAMFPRVVNGRHLALCRSDGETLGLSTRDEKHQWQDPIPLLVPHRGWELIQVGNCGSPLETEAGWLVLTHGVGPMRRYAIGAMLLDLDHPEKVLADLPFGLLEPDDNEREGYVPNVVYSCGGLIHEDLLWLPYGASDVRIGFACFPVDKLLDRMVPTGT